jgi:hypothetical protein
MPNDALRAKHGEQHRALKIRAACLEKRGDWAWMKSVLNLTSWAGEWEDGARRCCWMCKANFSDVPFTDATLSAGWRR